MLVKALLQIKRIQIYTHLYICNNDEHFTWFYNGRVKETAKKKGNIEKDGKMSVLMCSLANIIIEAPEGVGPRSNQRQSSLQRIKMKNNLNFI